MKTELYINGKEKIFTIPFVSGMSFRKLLEYDKNIDYFNLSLEDYETLVGFVCNVFGDQFTPDEFWNGIPSHEVESTILRVFSFVRTGEVPKEEVDSKNE